jgi:hypothetical protein
LAESFVWAVTYDCAVGAISAADRWFAYKAGSCAREREAQAQFGRIAEILKNLTIYSRMKTGIREEMTSGRLSGVQSPNVSMAA